MHQHQRWSRRPIPVHHTPIWLSRRPRQQAQDARGPTAREEYGSRSPAPEKTTIALDSLHDRHTNHVRDADGAGSEVLSHRLTSLLPSLGVRPGESRSRVGGKRKCMYVYTLNRESHTQHSLYATQLCVRIYRTRGALWVSNQPYGFHAHP